VDSHQADKGPGGIEYIDVVLDGVPHCRAAGFAPAYIRAALRIASAGTQVISRPSRRARLYVLRQLVETVRVFFHEGLVIKTFLADHMDHRQGQRLGRARAQLQPEVGPPGQFGSSWVHDNHLAPAVSWASPG